MKILRKVPGDYFITSGVGESDITIHAGSYHLALREAGIEMCNIVTYSSILPAKSKKKEYPGRAYFTHGQVLECITAESTAKYGSTATAGLIYGKLYDDAGTCHGGLVCEYNGNMFPEDAGKHLREMLEELYVNGYSHFALEEIEIVMRTVTPQKMYGTALVALCFTDHEYEEEMS